MERANGPVGRHAPGSTDLPDAERCLVILDRHGVPDHIRKHSVGVARLARRLAEDLGRHAPPPLDVPRLEAAALLHDIAKAACLESDSDHALEGGSLLRGMGLDAVADLVERHIDPGPLRPDGGLTEADILAYSDKRVLHERLVSLAERYRYLFDRYGSGGNADVAERIERTRRRMVEIETRIFSRLPYSPGDLSSEGRED